VAVALDARSISRSVQDLLQGRPRRARVVAVFARACIAVTPNDRVLALVTPQVGDGPLNVVVGAGGRGFAEVTPDSLVTLGGGELRIGAVEVALKRAAVWEPCPDWTALRARREAVVDSLPLVWTASLSHAPGESLLALVAGWAGRDVPSAPARSPCDSVALEVRGATELLRAGWEGDASRLREGAARLAGLGTGLTPAGDDFLVGVMLWAWLTHAHPSSTCGALAAVAAPRTTTLSAAFLQVAARGECSAPWHRLLGALGMGAGAGLPSAVRGILARGATSGADALAGFLWAWEVMGG